MVAVVLSILSVLLAFSSLAYAFRVARESRAQAELLAIQTDRLREQTNQISEMTERLSKVALNLGQTDYFLLRTLAQTTSSKPVFDEHGSLVGYEYEDEYGTATLTFRREGAGLAFHDVSLQTRPPD